MHFAQMHLEDIFISARLCVCVCVMVVLVFMKCHLFIIVR